jgi:hypothetical protein
MLFPWILIIILNGDILPWAGFQTQEACEQVRSALSAPKNSKLFCEKGTQT